MVRIVKLYSLVSCFIVLGLLFTLAGRAYALDIPSAPSSGYIIDNADIISPRDEARLNSQIDVFKEGSSNEIAILTVKDGKGVDPAQFATQVGREWGVGTKESKNGVVIFISLTNPKRIQIAVSTGLEGALTDATSGSISRNEIAPRFKESKYYEGLSAGVEAIAQVTKGEYVAKAEKEEPFAIFGGVLTFVIFALVFLQFLFSILASSKSWWLGGLFGGIGSGILAILINSWAALVVLSLIFVPLGILFDYILSKNYQKHAQKRKTHKDHNFPWYFGGGGGFGSGSSGGGFSGGGFSGGGSFGGGGGGSSW